MKRRVRESGNGRLGPDSPRRTSALLVRKRSFCTRFTHVFRSHGQSVYTPRRPCMAVARAVPSNDSLRALRQKPYCRLFLTRM